MHSKLMMVASLLAFAACIPAWAEDMNNMGMTPAEVAHEHGGETFHMFRLETDTGGGPQGSVNSWDLKGGIGTDENKLWLKTEGSYTRGKLEDAEFWALYSRNVATFWDAQAGIRRDVGPDAATYATFGFLGLAPYYFETEAHLFISDKGKLSARLREENDILFTQKLIAQPYAELNAYAQDVSEHQIGAGLADAKLGLQTRYEFTRKFAPYVDFSYGRKFGETSAIAKSNGEDTNGFIGAIGLRLMF